jgi:hypothetical protein
VSGPLDHLLVRGRSAKGSAFGGNLADRVLSAKVSLSAALSPDDYAVGQLTLVLTDPARDVYNTHLFDRGGSVDVGDLKCQVATHEVRDSPVGQELVIEARSWGAEKLVNDRSAGPWTSITLANLARQVAEPYGLKVVVQEAGLTPQGYARTAPDPNVPGDRGESCWDLLVRACREVGYVLIEAYSTLYVGRPTWLVRVLPTLTIDCRHTRLPGNVLAFPTCRRSSDDKGRDQLTVTVRVTMELALQCSPGMGLQLKGVERFGQKLLISRVEYDAADGLDGEGTISAVLPVDPGREDDPTITAAAPSTDAATATSGEFARFVNALREKESGGNYRELNPSGAAGAYQVMPRERDVWSRQVLGRTFTLEQWRSNPKVQDQVAITILWGYFQEHGLRGAAAKWYSGKAELQNDYGVKRKVTPTIGAYVDDVLDRMRTASTALPAGYTGPGTPPTVASLGGNRLARLSDDGVQRSRLFGPPGQEASYRRVGTPWGITVTVHPLVVGQFTAAVRDAAKLAWRPAIIGSYNNRSNVNKPSVKSLHSWALAWDFYSTPRYQSDIQGPTFAPPEEFRACFQAQGFYLGSDFSGRRDFPHIEWPSAPLLLPFVGG